MIWCVYAEVPSPVFAGLEAFKKDGYRTFNLTKNCDICREDDTRQARIRKCGHRFGDECVMAWLECYTTYPALGRGEELYVYEETPLKLGGPLMCPLKGCNATF